MKTLDPHPAAEIFPLLSGHELASLAEDIKAYGLREPITLLDGKVLDGRNRLAACKLAGVEPRFVEFKDADPLAFVVSANLHRRHLNESQRAMVAAKLANIKQGQVGGGHEKQSGKFAGLVDQSSAAKLLNVSERSLRTAKSIQRSSPKLAAKVAAGEISLHRAKKEADAAVSRRITIAAISKVASKARNSLESVSCLRVCSFDKLLSEVKPDAVITDPPYPKEFLPIYGRLAQACKGVPIVAVMCGQSYLPEIVAAMTAHLKYRWTMAYLTPGGQSAQQWQSKVNTFWKPVLVFGESAEWIGDVVTSRVNDKEYHHWGQSESGISQLVERLTKPGQLVCDPFLGGGTTAVAAFKLGRKFVGCDIESSCVQKTRQRLHALL